MHSESDVLLFNNEDVSLVMMCITNALLVT